MKGGVSADADMSNYQHVGFWIEDDPGFIIWIALQRNVASLVAKNPPCAVDYWLAGLLEYGILNTSLQSGLVLGASVCTGSNSSTVLSVMNREDSQLKFSW